MPAYDEEMNPVRRFHDRNAAVRVTLVPLRKIAIVDLTVTVTACDRIEAIARVHPEIAFDVVPGPTMFCDGSRMLKTQCHGAMASEHGGIRSDRAHCRAYRVQNASKIVALVIRH